ncbi:MAG: DUF1801 domain-containing protein [Deltaproteobacteria bacterium]|nr:DUF1801 domain-containing protein [Deltaproteobacteria bacterium]
MVSSKETSVSAYLASLPPERRDDVAALRARVNRALPKGFEETMQYGMISWIVPLARFATTYNGQPLAIASLAAQKSHNALYLFGAYAVPADAEKLAAGFARAGKKLDMGKSCLRWKTLDDLALEAIDDALRAVSVEQLIALHDAAHGAKKAVAKKAVAKKAVAKKAVAKRAVAKRAVAKRAVAKKPAPKKPAAKKR